jgi:hypothetical protein
MGLTPLEDRGKEGKGVAVPADPAAARKLVADAKLAVPLSLSHAVTLQRCEVNAQALHCTCNQSLPINDSTNVHQMCACIVCWRCQ